MIENPAQGVTVPDEMPHDYVLKIAKPYLGKWISTPSDWTPLEGRVNAFKGFNKPDLDKKDPWQFQNFLIDEAD
jgi:homospermidine synthase